MIANLIYLVLFLLRFVAYYRVVIINISLDIKY